MITVSAVSKAHGARVLFRDVSFQVVAGRRIAFVGHNGTGKTTLLEMIAGEQQPDDGTVARAKDVAVGVLRQEVAGPTLPGGGDGRPEPTVLDEVLAAADEVRGLERRMRELEAEVADTPAGERQEALLEEYGRVQHRFEHLGGYGLEAEARKVLAGLGFSDERVPGGPGGSGPARSIHGPVRALSGGWMMRVALARLLLSAPDVLLLDEPTNHLDLASVTWLETFLADYDGAVVVVSHDRDFINAVANRVVELARQTATEYVGDYAAFVAQRLLRDEQQAAAARNQQRKIAETERFIERFRYKATKARQVQSRVKALDKLDRIAAPESDGARIRFRFPPPPRAGRDVVRLSRVTKRYGDHVVYDGLDLVLERGQKVALVGPNGAGKTTLLRLVAGTLPPDAGERVLGHNVKVAYFAQHQVDALDLDKTVLQELAGVVDTAKVNPRSMLGAFLFSGDDVDKRVGVLSGGERSRLALAKMLADPVNLLCMDEPTNHLDIASRDMLEDALLEYPGTVVLITHDRHLIRSVANTIVEVGGGRATLYPGDFEYYAGTTGLDLDGSPGGSQGGSGPPNWTAPTTLLAAPAAPRDGDAKRAEAEARNRRYRATKDLRRRLDAVEAELGEAEGEVAELTRTLADPDVYADGERVKHLVAAHGAAKDRAAALFDEWERLSTALEDAAAKA